jgi:hypothetical protein
MEIPGERRTEISERRDGPADRKGERSAARGTITDPAGTSPGNMGRHDTGSTRFDFSDFVFLQLSNDEGRFTRYTQCEKSAP